MALRVRSGGLLTGPCSLSRLLLSDRRCWCSCSWPPYAPPSDSRRQGVSNFESLGASNGILQADIYAFTQPDIRRTFMTFERLPRDASKKTQLYEMRDSTLKKVCAGHISLLCDKIEMRRPRFCNVASGKYEEGINLGRHDFVEPAMRLAEDHKEQHNSLPSIIEETIEYKKLRADFLKQREHKKISIQASRDTSNNNNLGSAASSETFPTSGTNKNKNVPDEHKERLPETKIKNNKVALYVDQCKEASKRHTPLDKKLHEPSRQEQLRTNLLRMYDKIMVVNNIESARQVVKKLTTEYRDFVHACDTEVTKVDPKKETPVGHGEIISFSIYSFNGKRQADFGNGKSCIWVDVLDGEGCCTATGEKNLLMEFAPFFEDKSIKKVWHNYSFDSHIIQNYGIKLTGFHADTMHMARLWDSNRQINGGYSLEALTSNKEVMDGKPGRTTISNSRKTTGDEDMNFAKASMKSIFSRYKLKNDGTEGKTTIIDAVDTLQREHRDLWICYSAMDSFSTGKLFNSLKEKLKARDWVYNGDKYGDMFEFYQKMWRPFGELLVKMEREGMYVNRFYLREIEYVANTEQSVAGDRFRRWASKYCPDAKYMNVGSDAQVRQLLFGGALNSRDHNEYLPDERKFKILNTDSEIEYGKKKPTKFRTITLQKICQGNLATDIYTPNGFPSVSADALKVLAGKIPSEMIYGGDIVYDLGKVKYGTAYDAFFGGDEGKEACIAIAALCEICSIDSLLSNFIRPLQENQISCEKGRIHCSLNINTETGRLSARTPNLQNQPALEKDRYKIRQAFVAEPGNSLIVADYGQLELRILAHITGCKSMLEAFKKGGDFHSRTAMNMYDYINKAVKDNEVLLEWKPQPGEDKPPIPLLKDVYGAERRKAKMLNFSIAYGKTAMGLAQDWKVSVAEARDTVKKWYKGRSEVKMWQREQQKLAREKGYVRTLLGRERHFPKTETLTNSQRGHIDRAAINTPVQGSAADVAMCAMLEINANSRLKELGWRLLLQVHDEVILEGPTESAEEARSIVVECMAKPFNGQNILDVDLVVDAKCAKSWYEAK